MYNRACELFMYSLMYRSVKSTISGKPVSKDSLANAS